MFAFDHKLFAEKIREKQDAKTAENHQWFSMRNIASECKVNKSTVFRILNVEKNDLGIKTILKICTWLDVPIETFIKKDKK